MRDSPALKELMSVLGTATHAGHPGGARPCSERLALRLLSAWVVSLQQPQAGRTCPDRLSLDLCQPSSPNRVNLPVLVVISSHTCMFSHLFLPPWHSPF